MLMWIASFHELSLYPNNFYWIKKWKPDTNNVNKNKIT